MSCFNVPPDLTLLQEFQRELRPLSSFASWYEFTVYYKIYLFKIFTTHSRIDPTITSTFDLFLQCCDTGKSILLNVGNVIPPLPVPETLNYRDRFKNTQLSGR